MKKNFYTFAIFSLVFSSSLMAQFDEAKLINVGISFGLYEKYYDGTTSEILTEESISRPIHFQYEKGISDIVDLEEFSKYITVGVYAGLQAKQKYSKNYTGNNMFTKEAYKKYFYLWGGAVGTIHAVGLANKYLDISIPEDSWDIYLSTRLGLVYGKSKRNYETNPIELQTQVDEYEYKKDKTRLFFAPVIGARYYLMDKVSLFGEFGYANLSVISIGASIKL
ncbi:MAG: hypothetical protein K9H64_14595 [Bacteroidales bacterium]|nr:hypothetical protein [Bacteroidales bacterium]MCF8457196.1 hypothetical protein [Bacteroidales bacterium]